MFSPQMMKNKNLMVASNSRSTSSASAWLRHISHGPNALGSSLGTDSSMIAANDRCNTEKVVNDPFIVRYPVNNAASTSNFHKDSSMIAANNRRSFHSTSLARKQQQQQQQQQPESGAMQDEYGEMTSEGYTYVHDVPFELENGDVLEEAQLRYQTYGHLNEARDNVLVVCHALTGNASLDAWWGGVLGPGEAFDTDKYFIVCSNILGSCYGSTSPISINPKTSQPYGKDFPDISVKDTVRLQLNMLVNELQVNSIKSVIGGSFGGMQAMEFAVQAGASADSPYAAEGFFGGDDNKQPLVRSVIPIACGAAHTAWQIAISETQRQAIYADPMWESDGFQATQGLAVARQIGMVSYRTHAGYNQKFGRDMQAPKDGQKVKDVAYGKDANWKVKSYLQYQGVKFLTRFDPITYVKMTEQMDSHNVARGRGASLADVLSYVNIPSLILGIDSDILYPLREQEELNCFMPNSELHVIHSDDGHDGFLLEQDEVSKHIQEFLKKHK